MGSSLSFFAPDWLTRKAASSKRRAQGGSFDRRLKKLARFRSFTGLQELAQVVDRHSGGGPALAPNEQTNGDNRGGHKGEGTKQPSRRGQGEIVASHPGVDRMQRRIE